MCGHVEIGEQKDIKIITRDGGSYTPKNSGGGNPGSMLPVVTDAMPDKVQQFRWGLLSLDDDKIHSKNKHARIESLFLVPLWKDLIGRKHCVVRIQAFFEYNKEHQKTYRVERADGQPFYIAGLWDVWIDIKTNVLLPTFTMITMPPNQAMAEVHDRMPAILERNDIKTWINGSYTGEQRVAFLRAKPCASEVLKITVHKDHSTEK
ncbi:SOS response-associated peptidase family protein [Mucilaginibacter myungsuensis]|uniref:Abasic site processing protein n=1 Tax=Mucilaginibacter myungsuensis TaxID=649104 RepID=A0A929PX09_9SPHI|nr:SOS response-associated peptidase family protein [Mucilaginibacter myungsuensis]MBE9662661.1 SOS response-associated peptidase [Mucilaginibacter myungsuensis]MDN3598081.1 SOS response-associated peptidase family protein [Mucilaginibacter myungsuensis]